MTKVRTFSQVFPSYHPRKGEPTHFVEKIWKGLYPDDPDEALFNHECSAIWSVYKEIYLDLTPKFHTIRAGHYFKPGDWFKPAVWGNNINPKSGRSGPYQSKQIIFAPDIQVKKVWDVEIDACDIWAIGLPGTQIKYTDEIQEAAIAKNDGLTEQDLYWWFKGTNKPFVGQIICWNENIEY